MRLRAAPPPGAAPQRSPGLGGGGPGRGAGAGPFQTRPPPRGGGGGRAPPSRPPRAVPSRAVPELNRARASRAGLNPSVPCRAEPSHGGPRSHACPGPGTEPPLSAVLRLGVQVSPAAGTEHLFRAWHGSYPRSKGLLRDLRRAPGPCATEVLSPGPGSPHRSLVGPGRGA